MEYSMNFFICLICFCKTKETLAYRNDEHYEKERTKTKNRKRVLFKGL